MQRVNVNELVSGQKYFVKCGIWEVNAIYKNSVKRGNTTFYDFLICSSFSIFAPKSKLKIYLEV